MTLMMGCIYANIFYKPYKYIISYNNKIMLNINKEDMSKSNLLYRFNEYIYNHIASKRDLGIDKMRKILDEDLMNVKLYYNNKGLSI